MEAPTTRHCKSSRKKGFQLGSTKQNLNICNTLHEQFNTLPSQNQLSCSVHPMIMFVVTCLYLVS